MEYRAAKQHILAKLRTELSDKLYYHGMHHTLDVLRVANALCESEGVNGHSLVLVKTAALYHDAGFIKDKHAGHEYEGCLMARAILPGFGYSKEDIETICGMIMATKIPQSPTNLLEEIICDADLDYLGRDDFFQIGETLYQELTAYDLLPGEQAWNRLQVNFLTAHHFHTPTNRKLREPVKRKYLESLKNLVATYEV
ncbi:MAG: HD domain-containing protein [Bacteroidetes bacterium]|nr:MAG: HD domain-containing protein [Bacteroidota bacterium]